MIRHITIKNFKCFKNQSLKLNNLTILTGGNASGKSSVIQSILVINKSLELIKNHDVNNMLEIDDLYGLNLGLPENLIFQERESDIVEISCTVSTEELSNSEFGLTWDASVEGASPYALKVDIYGHNITDKILYINAERIGPRITSSIHDFKNTVGNKGEHSAYLMWKINTDQRLNTPMKLPANLEISAINRFSANCEEWISRIIPNTKVAFDVSPEFGLSTLKFSNHGDYYVPTTTGFGISYITPIVVQGLACSLEKNSILIVENPEAHLHPYSQSQMGKFLMLLASNGVQVIIETHSEHVINGCRLQAALMGISADINLHYFNKIKDNLEVREITVNEFGELSSWPDGFFDQSKKDIRELLELRRCGQ